MKRNAMILGAAAALIGAAVPVANIGGPAQLSMQAQNNAPAPKAMATATGVSITRRMNFLSGDSSYFGFDKPTYRKRPHGSVARDKRNALKARNQRRNKR